jgi:transposase
MRKVELFEVIRRDHHLKGWGVRRLAREHQVGRRLVRQALSSAVPPPRRAPEREAPVLGPAKPFINSILVGDLEAPRKQRHTAHRIWQRVRDELGIEVAESTVRQYVGGLKRALGAVDSVTVPQVHDPGEEAEVDFFKAAVLMAGMEVVLNFFQMRACHSGRVFVQAVARATQQAFLECMVAAFEYFDAVFPMVRMDNHRGAVSRVLRGRTRVETDRFVALRSHYLFETRYCRLGVQGAHEKGGVEGGQGHFRRNYLVPIPECRDLDDLNFQLLVACADDDQRIPYGRRETKLAAWEREWSRSRPLPEERFETAEWVEEIHVDQKSRAQVKCARYSVPVWLAGLKVRAQVSSDRVLIYYREHQVANWERCWEPHGERLDLDHYLELLRQKPQAFWNSLALRQAQEAGKFPPHYSELFVALRTRRGESEAARQMVDVLLLHRRFPIEVVSQAVAGVLAAGAIDGRAVAVLVHRATEGRPPLVVLELGQLDHYQRPQPQIEAYDQLLQEGEDES